MLVTKVVLWFFFPPLPSPPLLIKGTEMLMTAFPTGGMGHWDAICNLGVNLGRMHHLCWSLDVPSFGQSILLGPWGLRCPTNLCYARGAQGKLGKNFLNWDEYSPASLCLSLPPKRVQNLTFWVCLSLSSRCDNEVAPRALYIEFREALPFLAIWKKVLGLVWDSITFSKELNFKAISCVLMSIHAFMRILTMSHWSTPWAEGLVVSSKGHPRPFLGFLGHCQGFGCAREQRLVGGASSGCLSQ